MTSRTFTRHSSLIHVFLLLSLVFSGNILQTVTSLGINYGQVGNNLPSPDKVINLLRSLRITKTRIYDTNPQILSAFANSNIEIIVTIENQVLPLLQDPQQATQWVDSHIKPYVPATRITGIMVGNELFTDDDSSLIGYMMPAIINIHKALVQLGLDRYIQVSSPSSLAVLGESYPPSAGSFKPEVSSVMQQLLDFLEATKSPFWINAYPYFAYKDNPQEIPVDYVLFNRNIGMTDPNTRLHYDNMMYAQVDAVAFAAAKLGYRNIEVRVAETGWPSKGDVGEIGASPVNAATYNRNLMMRQFAGEGTPARRNARLDVYIFALFNEDMKPGPTSEKNYGIFQPDGSLAYNLGFSTMSTTTANSESVTYSSSATKAKRSLEYWTILILAMVQVVMLRLF
ncbi:putative glucan endo-1,3-beta-D-glucosidase [Arabidopsis thaliana]|jgi:exo-beta-1,3-glucanase (GH17 family)|uniref:glucan endo-1,3-beta-D-glucosidase n=4 Tax=Arabidopsis TaxID=3701 RepID=Q8L837_ARATH|nr:Glycosyl hydrolase superfamily protein [Arabidopsis thaliana]KAG7616471.1 Glycoside hydrolase superfamily [Arabidopsis thaliana x Arabidopsis arenosa]KAG7620943.1 Glycoside hydrolase superfamily [Arabidopsis suecica]AAM53322.1 beta-1,3-glucanase-like protein [Arabidopsis thaliana]AAN65119.1 beta-1,3-glucanase-like protein [Arabidopsis thaliana]AEE84029.1 Glycosyl hydrolase superfamily protein [Arabidopsis thaliana]|eukprot:NP_193568.2 Glycosyl hydrolase superfamily protein [Arabidopsis thaliana]